MTIKEQVLLLLEENKGNPISGEDMASSLGCSRAAVWKAVKSLETEGYKIEAVNNKGYTLTTSSDVLSDIFITKKLNEAGIDLKVITEKTVDSTNNVVKRMAADGESNDLVVIAEEQTAGRGRRGRSFFSPEGTGIYFSFLLHPNAKIEDVPCLTTLAVTAEAVAIEKIAGISTGIKWVNDLWVNGKKVSGILTEGSSSFEDGRFEYAVVGIGINLYEPKGGFPEEIKEVAGAVFPENASRENIKNLIASQVIIEFMNYYKSFPDRSYIKDYEKRCFAIGNRVKLVNSDHESLGEEVLVLGIDEDCHLHVRYDDGREAYLNSGEISIRSTTCSH